MNARIKLTALTLAITISAVLSACTVKTGKFAPTTANHPASPQAEEGEIEDPGKSLATSGDHSAAATKHSESDGTSKSSQTRYVCPMHPDVDSDQPGKCPRCGMDLKEKKPATSEEHVHEH